MAQATTIEINQIVGWNKTFRALANVFQDTSTLFTLMLPMIIMQTMHDQGCL
jgi:hypothetical protein